MKKLPKITISIYPLGTKVWFVSPKIQKFVPRTTSDQLTARRGTIVQALTHTFYCNDGRAVYPDVQYKVEYKNSSTKQSAWDDVYEHEVFETKAAAKQVINDLKQYKGVE